MKKTLLKITRQRPCLLIEGAGMRCPSPTSPSTSVRFRAHVSRSAKRVFILSFSVLLLIYLREKVSRNLKCGLKIIIRIFRFNLNLKFFFFFFFFTSRIKFLRPCSRWRPRRPPGSPMPRAGPDLEYKREVRDRSVLVHHRSV